MKYSRFLYNESKNEETGKLCLVHEAVIGSRWPFLSICSLRQKEQLRKKTGFLVKCIFRLPVALGSTVVVKTIK